jgi:cell division protein FtsB
MLKRKKRRSREFKSSSQVIDIEEARRERKKKRKDAAEKRGKTPKTKQVVTERQAGKKARRRMVYFFVFLFILCIIGVSAFNIVSLKLTEAKTMKEQQALLEQKDKLEKVYSQVNSPEYIEQQARQQLRMIKPGEILYVLPDEDGKKDKGGIIPQ